MMPKNIDILLLARGICVLKLAIHVVICDTHTIYTYLGRVASPSAEYLICENSFRVFNLCVSFAMSVKCTCTRTIERQWLMSQVKRCTRCPHRKCAMCMRTGAYINVCMWAACKLHAALQKHEHTFGNFFFEIPYIF